LARSKRPALVSQYLEGVSRSALEKYQDLVREIAQRRSGVYALYRGDPRSAKRYRVCIFALSRAGLRDWITVGLIDVIGGGRRFETASRHCDAGIGPPRSA